MTGTAAAKAWFEALQDHPDALLYTLDAEGRFQWIGGQARQMLGWTPDDVLGKPALAFLQPQPAPPPAAQHLEAKRAGREESSTFEARVKTKDGRTVWLAVTSKADRDAGGALRAIHGIAIDVTGRRRAQEALERSKGRLDEFVEAMHDVVYLHDLEGRFLMVNDAAVRLYGYSREEFLRMGIQAIVDPAHLARAGEQMRVKAEGKAKRSPPYEILTRTKAGRAVWMEVSSSAVVADGRTVAIQGIARNVNERKANDEALRLVQRVATATQGTEPFADVLAMACEGLAQATACARVEGWIPDADGTLRLQAAWPEQRIVQEEKFHRLSLKADFVRDSGIAARAARDGCPIWVQDVGQEPTFLRAAAAQAAGYRAMLVVPLLSGGDLVALLLLFTAQPSATPPAWQRLVESIASQLGVAFARRQAYDKAAGQAELLGLQMELAPIAMLLVGADGTVLGANHRFLELCGLKPVPNLRPFDASFVSRMPDPQAFVAQARDIYESDHRGADEVRVGERLLKRFVLDLPGPQGAPLGRAVFLRDITEQRRLEAELGTRRELPPA